jgi:polyphosphate glucokinase
MGMLVVGVDVGGSGIKGAPVDVSAGRSTHERYRIETPRPADVPAVVRTVAEVAARFGVPDRVGVTFPGVVSGGVVRTAANVDPSWLDAPAAELFSSAVGRPVTVLNDADAAGIAEVAFGAGRGQRGVVVMLTFGTGIGSAVFAGGVLVPNTELGHLQMRGVDAELLASDRARETESLGWPQWAHRVQEYLAYIESLLWPDLLIVGGGVSKKADRFLRYIETRAPVVPAMLRNNAGIVGAAMAAASVTGDGARPGRGR